MFKMRKMKKISIKNYIMQYTMALIFVMSVILLVLVKIMADTSIKYDVQRSLTREMIQNTQHVSSLDGNLYTDEEFWYEKDGMTYQLVSEDGSVLLGNLPNDMDVGESVRLGGIRLVQIGPERYYLCDRKCRQKIQENMFEPVYARCLINQKDIDSKYQLIEKSSYVTIAVFLVLMLIFGLTISKRISQPLMDMSATADAIGREETLTQRMEYGGRIRELQTMADTNNRMLDRLEQMFESQKQFSSDVAHELRTPVAVLLAQCEYARDNAETKEDFAEALNVICRQTKKTNDIITQLLNLNRMESGRVELDLEKVELGEMIRSICEEETENTSKDVHFECDLEDVEIKIDVSLIYVLLRNLIQNAVKYSPEPVQIQIRLWKECRQARISVTDHGDGISPEDLKHIFKAFFRVEQARSTDGFGLGLPLAERIAKIHGGWIEAESTPGEGSTFTVVLPGEPGTNGSTGRSNNGRHKPTVYAYPPTHTSGQGAE